LLLAEITQDFGFSYAQTKELYKSLTTHSGKEFYSATHHILKDRDQLIIKSKLSSHSEEVLIESTTQEVTFSNRLYQISKQTIQSDYLFHSSTAYLDLATLQFPLTLRSWKVADKLSPLGMKGRMKKVSDIFIDAKLNKFEKDKVGILVNGNGEIIWVAGFRLAEKFALTQDTTHLLKIRLHENE
jgi:tRNA(Ile)-lysidine synthase